MTAPLDTKSDETRREELKNLIAMLFPLSKQIRHIQQRYTHSLFCLLKCIVLTTRSGMLTLLVKIQSTAEPG